MHGIVYHIDKGHSAKNIYDKDDIFDIVGSETADYVIPFEEKEEKKAIAKLGETLTHLCGREVKVDGSRFVMELTASRQYAKVAKEYVDKFFEDLRKAPDALASPIIVQIARNAFEPYHETLIIYDGARYTLDEFIRMVREKRTTYTIVGAWNYHY